MQKKGCYTVQLKKVTLLVILCLFLACQQKELTINSVSVSQFETFVNQTGYITDAEKYGWSIVQLDVYNFKKVESANWKTPNGIDTLTTKYLPVTQVSYNDAIAYCEWAKKRLPSYDEYWELIKNDKRIVVSDNKLPISDVNTVNVLGNVWDITSTERDDGFIKLAGGSLFCSKNTCNGTVKERKLYVDKETGNYHIGFCVVD